MKSVRLDADLETKLAEFLALIRLLMDKVMPDSTITVQCETGFAETGLPDAEAWDARKYGRNMLYIWVKPISLIDNG